MSKKARSKGAAKAAKNAPRVGVIMGSRSDLPVMESAREILERFKVAFETKIVSAHRTPEWMMEYATTARARGIKVIIAAAGGAAHLPGMVAAVTTLPVLGVPIPATQLAGVDALLSIVQMPRGVPVGTLAIGAPGAENAALLAVQILGLEDQRLATELASWRAARRDKVLAERDV